jgi:hypothetical protein
MVARRWPLFQLLVRMIAVAEPGEDAALLGLHGFRLVVQPDLFETFLMNYLVVALAVAGLLHGGAGCGARTADVEGASGVYGSACVKRLAGVGFVDIVLDGGSRGDVLGLLVGYLRLLYGRRHTNDLLYESKLSREMLNGSFSLSRLRWFDDVVEALDLECQKVGLPCGGDGCRNVNQCPT